MYKEKRILSVVPARGGSKGIKLKNLRSVGNKSLIEWISHTTKDIGIIDEIITSTDHEEIAKECEKFQIKAPFRRPESLSGDRIGDLEVLSHALLTMEEINDCKYDVVVMLQPTSPLRTAEHVVGTIEKLVDGNFDSVWSVSETDSKGHPFKQLTIDNDELGYYDKENGGKIIARQQLTPVYHRNGAAYALTRECLIDQKSILGKKASYFLTDGPMISIDTEFDIELIDFYLCKKAGK